MHLCMHYVCMYVRMYACTYYCQRHYTYFRLLHSLSAADSISLMYVRHMCREINTARLCENSGSRRDVVQIIIMSCCAAFVGNKLTNAAQEPSRAKTLLQGYYGDEDVQPKTAIYRLRHKTITNVGPRQGF